MFIKIYIFNLKQSKKPEDQKTAKETKKKEYVEICAVYF